METHPTICIFKTFSFFVTDCSYTFYYSLLPITPMKVPHWYAVQVSDTTMMTRAASLPGQQIKGQQIIKALTQKTTCKQFM